MGRGEIK